MAAQLFRIAALLLAAVASQGLMAAGNVTRYEINSTAVYKGATFDELRSVAGEPRDVDTLRGGLIVEWVYRCERPGTGPCTIVESDGERELRVRFANGRLKGLSFRNR